MADANIPSSIFIDERLEVQIPEPPALGTNRGNLDSLFSTLKIFYEATNGDDWSYKNCPNNSKWNITKVPTSVVDLERWCGLTFTNGLLTELVLVDNNLTGSIPPELGDLRDLAILRLNGNQLTGIIPSELGNLKKLYFLNLAGNQLSGPIPLELTTMERLSDLYLGQNQLTGTIPPQLASLQQLTVLAIGNNQLTGTIPVEITTLENLTSLSLSSNKLTGTIPSEIGNLTRLERVNIGTTQMTGPIPEEFTNLGALRKLWVWEMPLTGADILQLAKMDQLDYLALVDNQWPEGIPSEIGEITPLTEWRGRSFNEIPSTIPPELGNLVNLQELNLAGSQLTGIIPSELGNLVNLTELSLSGTQLTGTIPPELGNLVNLKKLRLGGSQLIGSIPNELIRLRNLEELTLSGTLTGTIPPELGNLVNLKGLTLGGNQLTGAIPPSVGNLRDLEELRLGRNNLTGEVPPELGNLTNIEILNMRDNQLTGSFPQNFIELNNLSLFRFDTNSGLCAPSNQEFRNWLDTIQTVTGDICSVASFSSEITNQSFPVALPITPLILPEVMTGASPIQYTLNLLDLPLGLQYDYLTRTVSGTPTQVTPPIDFTYTATDVNNTQDSLQFTIEVYSSVGTEQDALPEEFILRSNYPNPFQHSTLLIMDLPWSAHIQVEIMDVTGRRVMQLPSVNINAGWEQKIEIDGVPLTSGLYMYHLTVDSPDGIFTHAGRFIRVH